MNRTQSSFPDFSQTIFGLHFNKALAWLWISTTKKWEVSNNNWAPSPKYRAPTILPSLCFKCQLCFVFLSVCNNFGSLYLGVNGFKILVERDKQNLPTYLKMREGGRRTWLFLNFPAWNRSQPWIATNVAACWILFEMWLFLKAKPQGKK